VTISVTLLSTILVLLALVAASPPAEADDGGPGVFAGPEDVTPLRRSDAINLFRPHRVPPDDPTEHLERRLEHDFGRLPSRNLTRPERTVPERRLRRDLEVGEQRLRTLKTRRPNAGATPLLERRLDRLQRPTRLGQ